MSRPAPRGDGSPARLIATMVGIVGILLLGSLTWSAVGALFAALGDAVSSLSPRSPAPKLPVAVVATVDTPRPTPTLAPPTLASIASPETPTPEPPRATATPTALVVARAPWVLLPQPAPGSHVAAGSQTIEARGRGDAPITAIRLELDGASIATAFEQRGESTWRAFGTVQISAGHHAVRATVVDKDGRTGGYRWTFDAGP